MIRRFLHPTLNFQLENAKRYSISGVKPCKSINNCILLKDGYFTCKKCRLAKCFKVGMRIDKVNGLIGKLETQKSLKKLKHKTDVISISVGAFIGRSNLIIFCAPQFDYPKQIIDVRFLVDQAARVLKTGLESPISASSSLEKLAFGLNRIRGTSKTKVQKLTSLGKEQFLALWQDDMLKVAKWLTYFDEFQQLPDQLKIEILKGIWRVWSRLDRLATTMIGRQNNICQDNMMMLNLEDNQVVIPIGSTQIDLSWMSRYNAHQLRLFGYQYIDEKTEELIQTMTDLQLTDVELTFMMCQLCFHYVGKRYQGVIMEVADRLMEVLSNDIHEYYTKILGTEKYALRISSMMKINNQIQQGIYQRRVKADLMRIFDVFYVEYSDPELFLDA
uniref:NR LBD domain-containing protein n=2 Tax=Caenorhabditis tropicalis TaxID=1561998 RepID=A0A1I7T1M4_9PELO